MTTPTPERAAQPQSRGEQWQVDECLDANDWSTIREYDGSANGDIDSLIATVYYAADARLIAAAPELLAACKAALLRLDEHDSQSVPEALQLRAAIAKAEQPQ